MALLTISTYLGMPTDCTDLHRLEITVVLCDEQSARNEAYPMNQNKKVSGPKNQNMKKTNSSKTISNRGPKPSTTRKLKYSAGVTGEYLKSLCDPFEHSGVKLGWGTLVPTRVSQSYVRGTTTANADGTCSILAFPDQVLAGWINNGGAAVNFTAGGIAVASSNAAAVNTNFTSGRVVSIGVRSYPVIAATSVPGIVYAGALQDLTQAQAALLTTNDLIAFPTSHMSIGNLGASSTGRPIDSTSFEFFDQVVNAGGFLGTTTVSVPFTIPYQAYSGLPASCVIAYEIVLNFEGIFKLQHGATPLGMGEDTDRTGLLSTQWNSVEQLWSAISPLLPPPGRPFEWAAVLDGQRQSQNLSRGSVSMGFPAPTRLLLR